MATYNIGGPVFAKIDGVLVRSRDDVSFSYGGYKAEDVVGSDGVHGFMEKPSVAMVKLKISKTPDLDIAAIKKKRTATISLPLPNGKTFTLANAWQVGEAEVNPNTGEVELEFHASVGVES